VSTIISFALQQFCHLYYACSRSIEPVYSVQEKGKATLTQRGLITQQLFAHDRNDPAASFPSLLAWVILLVFGNSKWHFFHKLVGFSDIFPTNWFISFLYLFLAHAGHVLVNSVEVSCQQLSSENLKVNYARTTISKYKIFVPEIRIFFPFTSTTVYIDIHVYHSVCMYLYVHIYVYIYVHIFKYMWRSPECLGLAKHHPSTT